MDAKHAEAAEQEAEMADSVPRISADSASLYLLARLVRAIVTATTGKAISKELRLTDTILDLMLDDALRAGL